MAENRPVHCKMPMNFTQTFEIFPQNKNIRQKAQIISSKCLANNQININMEYILIL